MSAAAVFAVNAGGLARWFKENMAVSVMLKQSTSEKEGRALAEQLAERPYVKESRFVSKEEGAEEMKGLLGEDFLSVFESSPIPISIDLKLDGDYITKDSLEWVKASLLDNRFVGDERFAKSFVRGKINQSGWGVNKIRFHLIQKGIAKELIDEALGQTDEEVYRQRLTDILSAKAKTIKAASVFEKKRKLAAYAMQKGFEGNLVWEVLKDLAI